MELDAHIPKRIAETRNLAKLSQSQLAKRLEVSPSLICSWEAGTRKPSLDQLLELSRHLGVPLDYLLKEKAQPTFQFRAAATLDGPKRIAVNELALQASAQIEYIAEVYHLAGQQVPVCMHWSEFSFPHVVQLAAHIRDIFKLNRRVTLAELKQAMAEQGIFVFEWNMPSHVSGMSYRGPITAIFVNYLHTPQRRLFTLAHELAHVLFHLGRSKEENAQISIHSFLDPIEKEANAFASELLLPLADVEVIAKRYGEDIRNPALMETVARGFNVSRDALFYRLTQLEICFWNEKAQFASPFENVEPGEARVTDIAAQVPSEFLEIALAIQLRKRESSSLIANWIATNESTANAYNLVLQKIQQTE